MGSEEILNQDVYGNKKEEHKCEIVIEEYVHIQFPEDMELRILSKERFKEYIEELSKFNDFIRIEIIDGKKCVIFRDSKTIYQEYNKSGDPKQIITELVDFKDNKNRSIFILEDFDKYLKENTIVNEVNIFRINGTRMIIFEDSIYQEKTKEDEHNKLYC